MHISSSSYDIYQALRREVDAFSVVSAKTGSLKCGVENHMQLPGMYPPPHMTCMYPPHMTEVVIKSTSTEPCFQKPHVVARYVSSSSYDMHVSSSSYDMHVSSSAYAYPPPLLTHVVAIPYSRSLMTCSRSLIDTGMVAVHWQSTTTANAPCTHPRMLSGTLRLPRCRKKENQNRRKKQYNDQPTNPV